MTELLLLLNLLKLKVKLACERTKFSSWFFPVIFSMWQNQNRNPNRWLPSFICFSTVSDMRTAGKRTAAEALGTHCFSPTFPNQKQTHKWLAHFPD